MRQPTTITLNDFYLATNGDGDSEIYPTIDALIIAAARPYSRLWGCTHVLHIIPDEDTARDVTEDVARAWFDSDAHFADGVPDIFEPIVGDAFNELFDERGNRITQRDAA